MKRYRNFSYKTKQETLYYRKILVCRESNTDVHIIQEYKDGMLKYIDALYNNYYQRYCKVKQNIRKKKKCNQEFFLFFLFDFIFKHYKQFKKGLSTTD